MIDEPILKKKVKRNKQFLKILFLMIFSILCLLGVTYAFFGFSKFDQIHSEVVTGNIYMNYRDNGGLTLTHIFPKSKEEGLQNDYFEFTVLGKNESKTNVYYAVNLMYGSDVLSKTRFNDEDMIFYLTEVISGNEEVLIDSVQYKTISNAKIWVETFKDDTTKEESHIYRLGMWLSENVLISDTNPKASYTTE